MAVTKRKRKKNPYRAEIFVSGVRVASAVFETKTAAQVWHDKTKKRWESGRGPLGEISLGELLEQYRDLEVPRMARSVQHRRKGLLAFLGECPVADRRMEGFDGRSVDDLVRWMLAHPRAKTPTRSSFYMELRTLRAVLHWFKAEQDELFVVPITKRHFRNARFKTKVARRTDFFIPEEKLGPWLEALGRRKDPVFRAIGLTQIVMGLRISELASICWDSVDLDRNLIHVRRTMDWFDENGKPIREAADRTKTPTSARSLPIPALVRAVLIERKRCHPLSTLVFRTRLGRPVRYKSVCANYELAFEEAGLDWSGTHICRHTHGTLGVKDGRTSEVQVSLGHSSERETLIYAKVHSIIENRIPGKVAELIEKSSAELHAQTHAQTPGVRKKSNGYGS